MRSNFFTHARYLFIAIACWLAIYLVGYGTLRCSDVLVCKQLLNYRTFTSLVTVIHSNSDRSGSEAAFYKNEAAHFAAFAYTPLRKLEESFWNWRGN